MLEFIDCMVWRMESICINMKCLWIGFLNGDFKCFHLNVIIDLKTENVEKFRKFRKLFLRETQD